MSLKQKKRRKQVTDKLPMGRYGRKVKWVAEADMVQFYESIKEAATDLHFAIQMYEVELKEQGWIDEHIEVKVQEMMNKVKNEIVEED